MSVEDILTEDDRALLDHLDEEIDDADDVAEVKEVAREIREKFARHRAEFRQFQAKTERRLDALEQRQSDTADEDAPELVRYAQFSEEQREDVLTTRQRIAVTLYEEWNEIAWTLGGGSNYAGTKNNQRIGVDTKTTANAKYNPGKLKHELRRSLGEDLDSNQVYRGMKALADLSGGEEYVDEDGRLHITGGWFVYHEKPTADGNDTKRVVWEENR